MRKQKFDKRVTRVIVTTLDRLARKYELEAVRHGVNRWALAQQAKRRYLKERQALEEKLADVNRRLRS